MLPNKQQHSQFDIGGINETCLFKERWVWMWRFINNVKSTLEFSDFQDSYELNKIKKKLNRRVFRREKSLDWDPRNQVSGLERYEIEYRKNVRTKSKTLVFSSYQKSNAGNEINAFQNNKSSAICISYWIKTNISFWNLGIIRNIIQGTQKLTSQQHSPPWGWTIRLRPWSKKSSL